MEPEPDPDSILRTRRVLLFSIWIAAVAAIGAAIIVALRNHNRSDDDDDGEAVESYAITLARANEARTRELIRANFVDAIESARAIQHAQTHDEKVTDAQRGAFLRATEELFTLERTYGRERMMAEIGSSYPIAVRKLQAMLQ